MPVKVTKIKGRKVSDDDESVYVLVDLPEDLHRYIKSEAALMKVKISNVIIEALEYWRQGRGK